MPPRKEPKETVVYAASKRKPPPFKPQRPSKVPRSSTIDSTSSRPQPGQKAIARTASASHAQPRRGTSFNGLKSLQDDADYGNRSGGQARSGQVEDDEEVVDSQSQSSLSSFDLPVDPRQAIQREVPRSGRAPPSPTRQTLMSSTDPSPSPSGQRPSDCLLSQSDTIPAIPQPLLVRLLHEHFSDKATQIDKHAIQVLQKYTEIFVREAIARTALRKQEEAGKGTNAGEIDEFGQMDLSWLELEDLEKVAAGMLLDF